MDDLTFIFRDDERQEFKVSRHGKALRIPFSEFADFVSLQVGSSVRNGVVSLSHFEKLLETLRREGSSKSQDSHVSAQKETEQSASKRLFSPRIWNRNIDDK